VNTRLRVHVEYGDLKVEFAGGPDDVTVAFLDFLGEVYPSFTLASRLIFKPNLVELSRKLEGVLEFSPDGVILAITDLTTEEAILVITLGVYVGSQLRILEDEAISVNHMANVSGKASKTILNQIKGMMDENLLERVGKGEYKIKSLGIRKAREILQQIQMR
jgi:hypothetical protein